MRRIIILLVFVNSINISAQDLDNGLIFNYQFNNNFDDSSINGLITSGSGQFGIDRFNINNNCLKLDGSSQYLTISNSIITKPNLPVSYAFWVNYDESGRWNHIFYSNYLANGYHGTWAQISPSGKIASGFGDGSGCICPSARQSFASEKLLNPNEWYFIIITIDKFSDFQLYINCNNEPFTISGSGDNTIAYDIQPANLGRSNSNEGIKYFKGSIDDFRYWNRKLSDVEINLLIEQNVLSYGQYLTHFLSYSVNNQIGSTQIDVLNKTINLEVECNADLMNVISSFSFSEGTVVKVGNTEQISGVTANDFTSPIIYTVSNDLYCTSSDWTVIVNKQEISNSETVLLTSFTSIELQDQSDYAKINAEDLTIIFEVICEANLNELYLLYTTESNTNLIYDGNTQNSGNSFNFSQPLDIELVNQNACVNRTWTIIVDKKAYTEEEILSIKEFFIPNVITPDDDGINETFKVGELLIGSSLSVFNRYGIPVYQSDNYQNKFNGSSLATGVYYYAIDNSCYPELIKGTLSILR